jgi:hypothetical protein
VKRLIQSVGAQLSVALLLVVAIALGVVYLTVVPSLRDRAVNTRVTEVAKVAAKLRSEITPTSPLTDEWVQVRSEENGGVRVVLLNRLAPSGLVVPYRDSGQLSPRLQGDSVATRALDAGRAEHGAVTEGETTYAEAAAPVLGGSYALLVRDPVELGSIRLVERRVLLAAGVALLIALLLGYLARGCSRGGSGVSSARPTGSRMDASTSRSWTPGAASSARSRRHSSGCESGWPT